MKHIIRLTTAGAEDVHCILRIESASFDQPWGRRAILDELAARNALRYIARPAELPAETNGVGFVFARVLSDEMHLMKIAVAPEWRHRGAATAMLDAVQTAAADRGAVRAILEVRTHNVAAIEFYRKAGYHSIGVRPNYYPLTGESALVMSKCLKEET